MLPPVTPETLALAAAYLGVFLGTYLVLRNLPWFDADSDAAEPSDGTVSCPECGRQNQVAFVYCRHCATEFGTVGGTAA